LTYRNGPSESSTAGTPPTVQAGGPIGPYSQVGASDSAYTRSVSDITDYPVTIALLARIDAPLGRSVPTISTNGIDTESLYAGLNDLRQPGGFTYITGTSPYTVTGPDSVPQDERVTVSYVLASDADRRLYLNDVQVGVDTTSVRFPNGLNRLLVATLNRPNLGYYRNGFYDEIRISANARSAASIKAGYANLLTPAAFFSFAAIQTP
jgi:hypothetical protein